VPFLDNWRKGVAEAIPNGFCFHRKKYNNLRAFKKVNEKRNSASNFSMKNMGFVCT